MNLDFSQRSSTFLRGLLLAAALCGLLVVQPATAQPGGRVVKMVVPYPAGGGTDLIARALAQALAAKWGNPVIIDNRAGASGALGTEAVAKSAGDGLTLLFTDAAPMVILPNLNAAQYKFKPLTDLSPIALVARQTLVLVVNNKIPAKNVGEFIEHAKRHPGLSYGTVGVGSYFHIAMEQFQKMAGVQMLHVPYKGTGGILTDLIGGQIDAALVSLPSVEGFERDKKLKILGLATASPVAMRPDLPVIGKSGLPDYEVRVWFGLFASAKTRPDLLEKLHKDVAEVLADPAFVQATLNPQFLTAGKESRAEFKVVMEADNVRWADLINKNDIKAE